MNRQQPTQVYTGYDVSAPLAKQQRPPFLPAQIDGSLAISAQLEIYRELAKHSDFKTQLDYAKYLIYVAEGT